MAIFKCSCGYSRELDDGQIGKRGRCPKCQTSVTVVGTDKLKKYEKTAETENSVESYNNSFGKLKCPHCNNSLDIKDFNLNKEDMIYILKNIMGINFTKEDMIDILKSVINVFKGKISRKEMFDILKDIISRESSYYLYVFPVILFFSIMGIIVGTDGMGNKINYVIMLLITGSVFFVYFDATCHKIGKISGKKGMLNNSAGMWSIGTLLLWIIVFPLYLIKRAKLISEAEREPNSIPEKRRKIVLSVIGIIFVLIYLMV